MFHSQKLRATLARGTQAGAVFRWGSLPGTLSRGEVNGRIPASDRIKLIEWLQAYSLQVKSAVGNAATTLRVTPGGYALEVVVLTQQFFAAGRPAEQLDLSFAYA